MLLALAPGEGLLTSSVWWMVSQDRCHQQGRPHTWNDLALSQPTLMVTNPGTTHSLWKAAIRS